MELLFHMFLLRGKPGVAGRFPFIVSDSEDIGPTTGTETEPTYPAILSVGMPLGG